MSRRGPIKILCLDGGDGRCMSQLQILEELLYRLEHRKRKNIRICEYFDLIVGVDGSGPTAVFLGLLKMTVDEAQEAYFNVHKTVLENDKRLPEARAQQLQTAVQDSLKSANLSDNIKLSDSSFADAPKVALCYVSAAHMNHCKMFRNYQAPQQITQDATVVQALHATWATPGFVAPALIGPPGREETLLSAIYGFSNPTQEAIKEAFRVFGPDVRVSSILSLGSGHRGITSLYDEENSAHSIGARMATDGEIIAETLQDRLGHLGIYFRLSVDHGLDHWTGSNDGFGAIKSHVDSYLSRIEISNKLNQYLDASDKNIGVPLEQLYHAQARTATRRVSHGLPPLSAYFVMRRKPMDRMIKCLIESNASPQRLMVMSGLGGSGKTQMALKFAQQFGHSYQHIFFIDASSSESIRREILARIRLLCAEGTVTTLEDVLDVLAGLNGTISKDWFIIFDNADDPEVDISQFIPQCDHGTILITTRDPSLESLAPQSSLALDTMDHDEAVEALIACVFPAQAGTRDTTSEIASPTVEDFRAAGAIAEELGHLPIAIIQAGCFIRQHQALHQYLDRLKSNRSDLLGHATRFHRDKLKYPHGVYASFDISINALSSHAVQLLGILSFFHYSNFPRLLLNVASKSNFMLEQFDILERPPEFGSAVQLLRDILCSNGAWSEFKVDELFEELQRYSLVTPMMLRIRTIYRFHPLVLNWARDRMTPEDHVRFQAASVRLLVCGVTKGDDQYLYDDLHIAEFDVSFDQLHANDRATLSAITRHTGDDKAYLEIWTQIYKEVEAIHGGESLRASRAALQMAAARGFRKAKELAHKVVKIRENLLGNDHPETIEALSVLARHTGKENWGLRRHILRTRIRTFGLYNNDVADAMMDMFFLPFMSRADQLQFISAATVIRTRLLGRTAQRTMRSLSMLGTWYRKNGNDPESARVRREILSRQRSIRGDESVDVAETLRKLAWTYLAQGLVEEAVDLLRSELNIRRKLQGDCHNDTIGTIYWLSDSLLLLQRFEEARQLLRECLEGWPNATKAVKNMVEVCLKLNAYSEAEEVCRTALEYIFMDEARAMMGELAQKFFDQGCSEESQGTHEEAERLWKQALRLSLMVGVRPKPDFSLECFTRAAHISGHLSLFYHKTGHYEQAKLADTAKRLAEELSESVFILDDDTPSQSMERLMSIVTAIQSYSIKATTNAPLQMEINTVTEDDASESLSASDPGGDPTFSPPLETPSALSLRLRPMSPFILRSMFRGPNSWSMF